MDYKKKVAYAERIATQLQGQKTTSEIRLSLKEEGLFDRDINNVMVSARKILGDKYQPQIKEFLLENKKVIGAEAFSSLDDDLLNKLIKSETQKLALVEKKKVTRFVKEGQSAEEILAKVDSRFLSKEQAAIQISEVTKVQDRNGVGMRSIFLSGGIACLLLTVVVMFATGRLFYILPIIGFTLLGKGLTTERMAYED